MSAPDVSLGWADGKRVIWVHSEGASIAVPAGEVPALVRALQGAMLEVLADAHARRADAHARRPAS